MRPTQKSRRGSDSPHTAVRCKFDTRSPKTSRASAWTGRTNRRQNHISQHTAGGRKPSRQAKNNALTKGRRGQKYHRRAHENRRTCDDRRVSERMHPPQSGKSTEKANQQARCPSALTGQTAEAPRKPHENGENPQALESNQASIENSTGAVGKHFGRATAGHFLFYNQIMLLSRENGAFFAECKKFILRDWTRRAQFVIIKGEDSF